MGRPRSWPPVLLATVGLALLLGCGRSESPAPVEYNGSGSYAAPPAAVADRAVERLPVPEDGRIVVESGDTLYAIARRYGVSVRALIDANDVESPHELLAGQVLKLPRGRDYVVEPGDTIYRISRCFGLDMDELVRLNAIEPPYVIFVGQKLRLPPQTAAAECPPPGQAVTVKSESGPPRPPVSARRARDDSMMSPPAVEKRAEAVPVSLPAPPPRAAGSFLWPVSGMLVAEFGPQPDGGHNDGVNIAADPGTPVRAAESGTVVYAGNELRGYGKMLLIRHSEGWVTAYAHNDELLVDRGDTVERGQIIARVGSTGSVARPQVHFELRKGAEAVDPVAHLSWN